MTRREQIIGFMQDKPNAVTTEYKKHTVITYTSERGHFNVVIFGARSYKAKHHYAFSTQEKRADYILKFKTDVDTNEQYQAQRKAELAAKKAALVADLKEGDIFYSSWGYEQTNVSFYQVIKVKNTTATFREIACEIIDREHDMSGKKTALKNEFVGEEFTKRAGNYGFSINSSESLSKWDGRPKYYSSYY